MSRRQLLQVGAATVLGPGMTLAPSNERHVVDTNPARERVKPAGAKEPTMETGQILRYLDEQFDLDRLGTNPPVLDNANLLLADARLSVFRSQRHWALFFEIVTCDRGSEMSLDFYAYGNCLRGVNDFAETGFLGHDSRSLFAWPEDRLPRSPDWEFALSRNGFSILLKGKRHDFSPTPQDYQRARIPFDGLRDRPDDLHPIELLRFLCCHLDHPFFAAEDHLRYLLDAYRPEPEEGAQPFSSHTLPLLLQTRQWQHPDGEPPSQVHGFQVLARAIETGDLSEWRRLDPATFNTDWPIYDAREKAAAEQSNALR